MSLPRRKLVRSNKTRLNDSSMNTATSRVWRRLPVQRLANCMGAFRRGLLIASDALQQNCGKAAQQYVCVEVVNGCFSSVYSLRDDGRWTLIEPKAEQEGR